MEDDAHLVMNEMGIIRYLKAKYFLKIFAQSYLSSAGGAGGLSHHFFSPA